MKLDIISANYVMMLLEEHAKPLLKEDDQKAFTVNSALKIANELAHSGASREHVQSFLNKHGVGPYEVGQAWYRSGNSNATNLVNHIAKNGIANDYDGNHKFHISDKQIHPHIIHSNFNEFLNTTYQNTQTAMEKAGEPPRFALYRGVNLDSDSYEHRPIESWTSHKPTAEAFGTTHVLQSEFSPKDVLWHYKHGEDNDFIPNDRELKGKEEHVVFGHRAKNLKIFKK